MILSSYSTAAAQFAFDNTYARELEGFYVPWTAAQVARPALVQLNRALAEELGLDAEAFDVKLAAAQHLSLVDFALWGGLIPGHVDRLEDLAERGVIGFKAFMSRSGTDDFPHADDGTLWQGMRAAARLGLPVAVHA